MAFEKAVAIKQSLRMAIVGPGGSGKTMTALKIAGYMGESTAVIDTERGKSKMYVGLDEIPAFDISELTSFNPSDAAKIIRSASGSYDTLIIDSGTHFWNGEGGVLDIVSKKGNDFKAWAGVKADEQAFIAAMLDFKGHVIITYRTSNEYLEAEKNGKIVRKKIGLKPQTREGMEYEQDFILYMDDENVGHTDKTRFPELAGKSWRYPGRELALALKACTERGVEGAKSLVTTIREALAVANTKDQLDKWVAAYGSVMKTVAAVEADVIRALYRERAALINSSAQGKEDGGN